MLNRDARRGRSDQCSYMMAQEARPVVIPGYSHQYGLETLWAVFPQTKVIIRIIL